VTLETEDIWNYSQIPIFPNPCQTWTKDIPKSLPNLNQGYSQIFAKLSSLKANLALLPT